MPLNNDLYLGVDGGGTKTVCVIGDVDGRIRAAAEGASTNLKSRPPEKVKEAIFDVLSRVLQWESGGLERIKSVHVSTAGGDREEDRQRWKQWLSEFGLKPEWLIVENDAVGALAAGTGSKNGTVLIAGTGSIAYSVRDELPKPIRVGGWGYLFGDEGSGYDIGCQALRAVARAHDGRGSSETKLTTAVLDRFGLTSSDQLITFIYEDRYPRKLVASLARGVIGLAEQGDLPAIEIVAQAVNSLTEMVLAIFQCDEKSRKLPLVVSGGLFHSAYFRDVFENNIRKTGFTEKIIVPKYPPVIGSYLCAHLQDGKNITNEVMMNINETWKGVFSVAHRDRDGGRNYDGS